MLVTTRFPVFIALLVLTGCSVLEPYRRADFSWGPTAPMARTSRATVGVLDSVVAVGGTYWVDTEDHKVAKVYSAEVFRFDTSTEEWQELPDYPIPAGYAFATAVDSRIFVVGGRGYRRANSETFIMDLSEADPCWIPGPVLPAPRYGDVGGVIGSVIYIAGGVEGELSQKPEEAPSPGVLALDTANLDQGWHFIAQLPEPATQWRYGTTCGDRLYLFGGMAQESVAQETTTEAGTPRVAENNLLPYVPQDEAFALDVKSRQWTKLPSLPLAKLSGGCIALDERYLLIVGGVDMVATAQQTPDQRPRISFSPECWLFDTQNNSYQMVAYLKKSVGDQGLAYIDGKLYVIAGEANPFKTRTDLVQIGTFK